MEQDLLISYWKNSNWDEFVNLAVKQECLIITKQLFKSLSTGTDMSNGK